MVEVGTAWRVINNDIGRPIQGATVFENARFVRDDCEANALFLRKAGEGVLIVSCDVVGVPTGELGPILRAMSEACGLPEECIVVGGTHMHSGPSVIPTHPEKEVDRAYFAKLADWLCRLAADAVATAQPARVGWGCGVSRIGYNRRCCWADGSHTMHGDTRREDFTGLEGPEDPSHVALFALNAENEPLAVLYNCASHPTCFYGADFYSADYPGQARASLRESLGDIAVVYLNGAFGDLAVSNQLARHSWPESREQRMLRAAHIASGETLRLMHEAAFDEDPGFGHVHEEMPAEVRLPSRETLKRAEEILAQNGEGFGAMEHCMAFGAKLLQDEFGGDPVDTIPLHAVRIGDVALLTQPFELYCQYGLDIKRRSAAPITAVCHSGGYNGYLPTLAGALGGGYSGEPIHWTRFSPETGCRLVDAASRLIWKLWR